MAMNCEPRPDLYSADHLNGIARVTTISRPPGQRFVATGRLFASDVAAASISPVHQVGHSDPAVGFVVSLSNEVGSDPRVCEFLLHLLQ